jgi:hypothetical protein
MNTSSVIRLYDILQRLNKIKDPQQKMWAIEGLFELLEISEHFGINDDEKEEIEDIKLAEKQLSLIFEFKKLIRKAKMEIISLDVNHELYLKYYHKIEALDRSVADLHKMYWKNYKQSVDALAMHGLEHCVELVKRKPLETAIDEDDLLKIKQEVENLTNEVLEKKIDTALKKLIISLLENIKLAIIEYKINGIESFEKVLEQSIGKLIYNRALWDIEPAKKDIEEVSKILKKISGFIEVAKSMKELAQGLINMLPSILP